MKDQSIDKTKVMVGINELRRENEARLTAFREILALGDIKLGKELVDIYVDTAILISKMFRKSKKHLKNDEEDLAKERATKALLLQDTILEPIESKVAKLCYPE